MKRASYREAVEWIALNDSAGDDDPPEILSGLVTVCLIADLFGESTERVARDVIRVRRREGLTAHRIPPISRPTVG
jgi:hypothetical protein